MSKNKQVKYVTREKEVKLVKATLRKIEKLILELANVRRDKSDSTVAGQVIAVLSALRGPDAPDSYAAKRATTAIIRYMAFPKLAELGLLGDFNSLPKLSREDIYTLVAGSHFANHILWAAEALGAVEPSSDL